MEDVPDLRPSAPGGRAVTYPAQRLAGLRPRPRKLSDQDVARIRELRAQGGKQEWIAAVFGVRQHTISRICSGKRRAA